MEKLNWRDSHRLAMRRTWGVRVISRHWGVVQRGCADIMAHIGGLRSTTDGSGVCQALSRGSSKSPRYARIVGQSSVFTGAAVLATAIGSWSGRLVDAAGADGKPSTSHDYWRDERFHVVPGRHRPIGVVDAQRQLPGDLSMDLRSSSARSLHVEERAIRHPEAYADSRNDFGQLHVHGGGVDSSRNLLRGMGNGAGKLDSSTDAGSRTQRRRLSSSSSECTGTTLSSSQCISCTEWGSCDFGFDALDPAPFCYSVSEDDSGTVGEECSTDRCCEAIDVENCSEWECRSGHVNIDVSCHVGAYTSYAGSLDLCGDSTCCELGCSSSDCVTCSDWDCGYGWEADESVADVVCLDVDDSSDSFSSDRCGDSKCCKYAEYEECDDFPCPAGYESLVGSCYLGDRRILQEGGASSSASTSVLGGCDEATCCELLCESSSDCASCSEWECSFGYENDPDAGNCLLDDAGSSSSTDKCSDLTCCTVLDIAECSDYPCPDGYTNLDDACDFNDFFSRKLQSEDTTDLAECSRDTCCQFVDVRSCTEWDCPEDHRSLDGACYFREGGSSGSTLDNQCSDDLCCEFKTPAPTPRAISLSTPQPSFSPSREVTPVPASGATPYSSAPPTATATLTATSAPKGKREKTPSPAFGSSDTSLPPTIASTSPTMSDIAIPAPEMTTRAPSPAPEPGDTASPTTSSALNPPSILTMAPTAERTPSGTPTSSREAPEASSDAETAHPTALPSPAGGGGNFVTSSPGIADGAQDGEEEDPGHSGTIAARAISGLAMVGVAIVSLGSLTRKDLTSAALTRGGASSRSGATLTTVADAGAGAEAGAAHVGEGALTTGITGVQGDEGVAGAVGPANLTREAGDKYRSSRRPSATLALILMTQLQFIATLSLVKYVMRGRGWLADFTVGLRWTNLWVPADSLAEDILSAGCATSTHPSGLNALMFIGNTFLIAGILLLIIIVHVVIVSGVEAHWMIEERAKRIVAAARFRSAHARQFPARFRGGRILRRTSHSLDSDGYVSSPSESGRDLAPIAEGSGNDAPQRGLIPLVARERSRVDPVACCRERSSSAWLYFPHVELVFLMLSFQGAVGSQASAMKNSECRQIFATAMTALVIFPVATFVMAWRVWRVRVRPDTVVVFRRYGSRVGRHAPTSRGSFLSRLKTSWSDDCRMFAWADKGWWETVETPDRRARKEADWFRIGFEPLFVDFTKNGACFVVISLATWAAIACVAALVEDSALKLSIICSLHGLMLLVLLCVRPFANRVVNNMALCLAAVNAVSVGLLAVSAARWEPSDMSATVNTAVLVVQLLALCALVVPIYLDAASIVKGTAGRVVRTVLCEVGNEDDKSNELDVVMHRSYTAQNVFGTWCSMVCHNVAALARDTREGLRRPSPHSAGQTGPVPPGDSSGRPSIQYLSDDIIGSASTPVAVPSDRMQAEESRASAWGNFPAPPRPVGASVADTFADPSFNDLNAVQGGASGKGLVQQGAFSSAKAGAFGPDENSTPSAPTSGSTRRLLHDGGDARQASSPYNSLNSALNSSPSSTPDSSPNISSNISSNSSSNISLRDTQKISPESSPNISHKDSSALAITQDTIPKGNRPSRASEWGFVSAQGQGARMQVADPDSILDASYDTLTAVEGKASGKGIVQQGRNASWREIEEVLAGQTGRGDSSGTVTSQEEAHVSSPSLMHGKDNDGPNTRASGRGLLGENDLLTGAGSTDMVPRVSSPVTSAVPRMHGVVYVSSSTLDSSWGSRDIATDDLKSMGPEGPSGRSLMRRGPSDGDASALGLRGEPGSLNDDMMKLLSPQSNICMDSAAGSERFSGRSKDFMPRSQSWRERPQHASTRLDGAEVDTGSADGSAISPGTEAFVPRIAEGVRTPSEAILGIGRRAVVDESSRTSSSKHSSLNLPSLAARSGSDADGASGAHQQASSEGSDSIRRSGSVRHGPHGPLACPPRGPAYADFPKSLTTSMPAADQVVESVDHECADVRSSNEEGRHTRRPSDQPSSPGHERGVKGSSNAPRRASWANAPCTVDHPRRRPSCTRVAHQSGFEFGKVEEDAGKYAEIARPGIGGSAAGASKKFVLNALVGNKREPVQSDLPRRRSSEFSVSEHLSDGKVIDEHDDTAYV